MQVRPQVDGRLDAVLFKEGQFVKKGDVLAQVDPRPFTIQLHTAQAAVAKDSATLRDNKLNLDRYVTLRKQNLIAQQQQDDQQALVDQTAASVQSDQAMIESAKLNLDWARIVSPVDGITGVRNVDPGNIVHASDTTSTGIVIITQMDPIAVLFTLPEDDLSRVSRTLQKGRSPSRRTAATGTSCSRPASCSSSTTRSTRPTASIRLKAMFANPDRKLWPNEFVKTRLLLTTRKDALVVPAAVVQRGPSGTFAYVVGAAEPGGMAPVTVDVIQGDTAIISKGVTARAAGGRRRAEPAEAREQGAARGAPELSPSAAAADTTSPPDPSEGRQLMDQEDATLPGTSPPGAPKPAEGGDKHGGESPPGTHASISEPFIRRPVATTLLMIGLCLAGMLGFYQLPISALPQVDYPTIVVSTFLPGASADTMASAVTTPLERQLGQMPSLSSMTSVSSFGSSQITVQFTLDRNIDAAEQDVQAAINAASSVLPTTLPTPPIYSKSNPADTPILTLSVSSETLSLDQVDDVADSILGQKISQVSGVGLVTLNGGQKPAVRVQVDPEALAGAGLSLEDVRAALVGANVNEAKGNLDGVRQDYTLATNDQLFKADGFKTLIIAYKNGSPIRVGDVADASTAWRTRSWPAGPTRSAPSSSTSSGSRARTSSRSPTR